MPPLAAIFDAIAAIPQIAGYLNQFAVAITVWYLGKVTDDNKQAIMDAAAYAVRAKTPAERSVALDMWRAALSRSRVSA